ncbi:hypothetical protein C7M84_016550 [Penaeus vannamei]|uniref:Uncharacterized protein n=1 Tax=Penaeus vannamei TaxID=6689 RepID=A0A3R7Q0K2_PENVA|nr:hypothetical protein C7M84_016550 [Penaeus vannamei]
MSKFDELLILLGTGRWNLVTFFAAGYWMIQVPCQSVGGAFLTPEVDHSCRLPPEATNVSEVSQCKYNVTTSVGSFEERPCLQWDFDNTTYTNTLTSEFQLVCEYRFLRPAFKSLYFFGAFVGAPLNGWLSDKRLTDLSPFVLKLETYLRMAEVPYQTFDLILSRILLILSRTPRPNTLTHSRPDHSHALTTFDLILSRTHDLDLILSRTHHPRPDTPTHSPPST